MTDRKHTKDDGKRRAPAAKAAGKQDAPAACRHPSCASCPSCRRLCSSWCAAP